KELDYNVEFAKELIDGGYVEYNWNRRSELKNNNIKNAAKKIVSAGGLIMEMCAGPGGGLMPHILDENSNAGIIISVCP
ncbi:MAG: hypothetical protein LBG76_00905, partial [Treponema sp.]|nr:hypothetical protein [Treponema sp.]